MANSQVDLGVPRQDASTSTAIQPKQAKSSIVELKNGKAVLRQKLLPLEKLSETMQETVKFREFFEAKVKEDASKLDAFPQEHLPLLAKLVQESEKTAYVISKHIHDSLKPLSEETQASDSDAPTTFETILPQALIELAIASVATRVNYGLDGPGKIPAALSLWRWEVKENYRGWLPSSVQDKLQARRLERQQAKEDLRRIFDALPAPEREALLKTNKKQKVEGTGVITFSLNRSGSDENVPIPASQETTDHAQNGEGSSSTSVSLAKKEKIVDPEKLAKEKEKAEKKAAKVEKERKEKESQNKSRSLLSSFLKPKVTAVKAGPIRHKSLNGTSASVDNSATSTDFEKTFKPFIIKKDAILAPSNYFLDRRKGKEVITIDVDEPAVSPVASSSKVQTGFANVNYTNFLAEARSKSQRRRPKTTNLKSSSRYCVRDLLSQLSEAEVLGDDVTVRRILSLLESREKIPAKVLIFDEDTRPGYFGTFTKSSSTVGPRTPFAKDAVVFDYGYDSGAEWEEEEAGDDLVSVDGSAEDAGSDVDSEMGDWLVEDDDEAEPGTPLDDREGSPGLPLPPNLSPSSGKRKVSEAPDKKKTKKRKVMPLVPFTKGPCYEDRIGDCAYEPLKEYRIQLFNDTPFPIDPFTFVSTPFVETRQPQMKDGFVVPPLPKHMQREQTVNSTAQASTSILVPMEVDPPSSTFIISTTSNPPALPVKRKTGPATNLPPKTPFPDSLLPILAQTMEKLETGNLTWIIENIYRDLKAHKVKKNAIEAKIKEIGEKCPVKRIWKVKDDILKTMVTPVA